MNMKDKSELLFELDGKVFIVEKENGQEVLREEMDGKVVLQCIMKCLKDGLDKLDKETP